MPPKPIKIDIVVSEDGLHGQVVCPVCGRARFVSLPHAKYRRGVGRCSRCAAEIASEKAKETLRRRQESLHAKAGMRGNFSSRDRVRPCGKIIALARRGKRCDRGDECPSYFNGVDGCLDVAAEGNWDGWRTVEAKG